MIKAQEILESKYDVAADVWSVTSYSELYRDGHACERWNMLHPARDAARAVRDAVPEGRTGRVRRGVRLREGAAGLDRSLAAAAADVRSAPTASAAARTAPAARVLRGGCSLRHVATLAALAQDGKIEPEVVQQAIKDLDINPEKNPDLAISA